MPEPLRIRIRSDWDAALTYDSLHEESENRPVFVGREVLIAPLVVEITEPNKRGTYLISGYRGTGKTTLLIEALSRAKKQLAASNIRLFPLVLNVSEVSASLGNSAADTPLQLDIDPRRILIALIRTIRDGIQRLPSKDNSLEELAKTVDYVYQKATAAKFSSSGKSSQEDTRSRAWELALAIEDKNVLKTLAAVSGAAAIAFESAALIGPSLGWFHAAAVALAAVFAVSFTASMKRSRSQKQTEAKETALEHDNSLQQLETDLKDIFAALKQNRLRTVVVMEELDKIDDPKGQQLAAVIRYFKNLFTQAPALFFFVTDKGYFDIIASAIKRARRGRSYAVEHTFFTHRIFVGRPSTDESLQFIAAIAGDGDRKAIEAVAQTLGKPGRINEVDQLGRFIRVVLFYAANHLFDLKNELRRFARSKEEQYNGQPIRVSSFVIDDQTLPPEEAALAVFQDLIVEKIRSFEIKGGRAYANETLADSLYAVFNEVGSKQPQKINSFLPMNTDTTDALLLDEQLDLREAARVREAVYSLVDDLERGRALESRDPSANTFTWRADAAQSFRYVRQLQKHEESLIAELQRYAALANSLPDYGEFPHPLSTEFEERVNELRNAPEALTADAALALQRDVLDRYSAALSESFNAHLGKLGVYGFVFEEVARGLGGSLHLVKPRSGDPRLRTSGPRGGVLLAFGETETLMTDVLSFMRPIGTSLSPLDRLGLVHVVHISGTVGAEIVSWEERWAKFFAEQAESFPGFRYAVDVLALVDPFLKPQLTPVEDSDVDEVQRLAASLAGFGAWARAGERPYEFIRSDIPPLDQALEGWKGSGASLFHIPAPPGESLRGFAERDILEDSGAVVLSLFQLPPKGDRSIADIIGSTCMLRGYDQAIGGPDRWEPIGKWLLSHGRIYLFVNWQHRLSWEASDFMKASALGAKIILVNPDSVPAGFEGITFLKAPLPTPASEVKS
jgi:KaiC/GvpD/RAD55 family RecA-like ATPase